MGSTESGRRSGFNDVSVHGPTEDGSSLQTYRRGSVSAVGGSVSFTHLDWGEVCVWVIVCGVGMKENNRIGIGSWGLDG